MKKILFISLVLWFFIGCASLNQQTQSRAQQLVDMCYNQNNQQACQTLLVESRVQCNNYDPYQGCPAMAEIYRYALKGQSIVRNTSEAEAFKNFIFYTTKSCMLGNMLACQGMEGIKISLEQYQ